MLTLVQGSDHATFPGGVSTIVTSTNEVDLTPTGKSTAPRDVGVQVTVNGVTSSTFSITIHALDRLAAGTIQDSASSTNGFDSHINYAVTDQFGSAPPYDTGINEFFPSPQQNDYAGTNWVGSAPGGITIPQAYQGQFFDELEGPLINGSPTPIPVPIVPQSSGTKIFHLAQQWRAGSATPGVGYLSQTDSIQDYIDHGLHFNIVSPVP
jgi:hypothetical protein